MQLAALMLARRSRRALAAQRRRARRPRAVSGITVFAAASLTDVFPQIDAAPKYSFGGSNTLAAQIKHGAPADVFASANTTIPEQLYAKGLVREAGRLHAEQARARRAEVEPRRHPHIYDLTKPGVKLVVAAPRRPRRATRCRC